MHPTLVRQLLKGIDDEPKGCLLDIWLGPLVLLSQVSKLQGSLVLGPLEGTSGHLQHKGHFYTCKRRSARCFDERPVLHRLQLYKR